MARLCKLLAALLLICSTIDAQLILPGPVMRTIAASGGGFSANATTFAGDGQAYLQNTASFGGADGNTGIFSVWVKPNASGTIERIIYSTAGHVRMARVSDNTVEIVLTDSAGTTLIHANSTGTITADGNWHHVIASWDRATDNNITFAVDGTTGTTITTFLSTAEDPDPIDYELFLWNIGGLGGTDDMNGCLSEVYIAPNQFIDLTVQANREKWRSSGGSPVDLGSDGSTPTGTAPRGYFKNEFSTFTTNSGTGGNFSKEGTTALTSCTAP